MAASCGSNNDSFVNISKNSTIPSISIVEGWTNEINNSVFYQINLHQLESYFVVYKFVLLNDKEKDNCVSTMCVCVYVCWGLGLGLGLVLSHALLCKKAFLNNVHDRHRVWK